MSLLQTFDRISAALTGDAGPVSRKRTDRPHYFPDGHYHPLWGTGLPQNPSVAKVSANIPFQRRFNPTNTAGNVFFKEDPITGDPEFWKAFHARKHNAWGTNYEPTWRMHPRDYLPRTELSYRNIGDNEQIGSLRPNTVYSHTPIQHGVVSFSSLNTRP